jgi:hypothetical protein
VLNNVPGSDAVNEESPQGRLVMHGVYLLGVFLFAVLLGEAACQGGCGWAARVERPAAGIRPVGLGTGMPPPAPGPGLADAACQR